MIPGKILFEIMFFWIYMRWKGYRSHIEINIYKVNECCCIYLVSKLLICLDVDLEVVGSCKLWWEIVFKQKVKKIRYIKLIVKLYLIKKFIENICNNCGSDYKVESIFYCWGGIMSFSWGKNIKVVNKFKVVDEGKGFWSLKIKRETNCIIFNIIGILLLNSLWNGKINNGFHLWKGWIVSKVVLHILINLISGIKDLQENRNF